MARRRRRKHTTRRRHNPSTRIRKATRAIASRARGGLSGLQVKSALKEVPLHMIGMFAAKWAAKRFGGGASEVDNASWDYASFLKGALGAIAGGFLANMVRPGSGQKVLVGGLSLMGYELLQRKIIPNSPWAVGQFGFGADDVRTPGTIEENSVGEPYILGEDYQWRPINGADDLIPESVSYGEAVMAPGPLGFAGALMQPGPLGFGAESVDDVYRQSFLRR